MPAIFRLADPWDDNDTQAQGSSNVITNDIPTARLNDATEGWDHPPGIVTTASTTVFANNIGVARVGDQDTWHDSSGTHHANAAAGSPNVFANSGDGPPASLPQAKEVVTVFDALMVSNDEVADSIPINIIAAARVQSGLPPTQAPATPTAEDNTPPTPPASTPIDCVDVASHDDNFPSTFALSPHFTLGMLTLTPSQQPNQTLQPQAGLTVQEIVCNLRHLCINILEPYLALYPDLRINSGFRLIQNNSAKTISQHCTGQAVDIGFPGTPGTDTYWTRAQALKNQLAFDQYILEYNRFGWYHFSFNKRGNRTQILSADLQSTTSPLYKPGLLKLR